jgi:hypothetical protein
MDCGACAARWLISLLPVHFHPLEMGRWMEARPDEIPQEVRAFIGTHVGSVVQLETLLMLHTTPGREFEPEDVARDLRIDRAWAEAQLDTLWQQGLLVRTETTVPRRYQYGPAPETKKAVDGLARAYAERRVTVISLIFAKPADSLRAFSDAFRIRKDKEGEDRG